MSAASVFQQDTKMLDLAADYLSSYTINKGNHCNLPVLYSIT